MPRYPRRLVFIGGTTIHQSGQKIEVTAWLYAEGEAPASSFVGRYLMFDNDPDLHEGPALFQFSSGDEADAVITHVRPVRPRSGRFKISEHLRPLSVLGFAEPS